LDYKEYLAEWRELMSMSPDSIYYEHTYLRRESDFVTVEDRRHSVAGVFAIEGWTIPPSMEEYLV
jgi:hypothetical protein